MYEFHKNSKGEETEGYLGNPEDFKGIVFLLREPNNSNKKEQEFWFKKVLGDLEGYCQEQKDKGNSTATTKRAATKYINRFREMLMALKYHKNDLNNAIFCNVHPDFGDKYKSKKYNEVMKERSIKILEDLSEEYSELTIFTCRDIYANFKEFLNSDKEDDGLEYAKNKLKYFETEYNSCHIKIYEIYHPSYGSRINTSP